MVEVVGDCGHDPKIDGCISCYPGDSPDGRPARDGDDLDAAGARMARIAAVIGPAPTCDEHGRTPCDVCGASWQPMQDSGPEEGEASEDGQANWQSGLVVPIRPGRRLR